MWIISGATNMTEKREEQQEEYRADRHLESSLVPAPPPQQYHSQRRARRAKIHKDDSDTTSIHLPSLTTELDGLPTL